MNVKDVVKMQHCKQNIITACVMLYNIIYFILCIYLYYINFKHLDSNETMNISIRFKFKLFPILNFSSLTSYQCYGTDLYIRYKLNLTNEEYEQLKKFNLLEGFTISKN